MGRLCLRIGLYLLLSNIIRPTIPTAERPRMIFTEKETSALRRRIAAPAEKIILEGDDAVTLIGTTQITQINFHNRSKIHETVAVQWDECANNPCVYNITVAHKSQEANHTFFCGTNGRETACCNMNISGHSARCTSSDKVNSIKESIRHFITKEGEPSAFVESPDSADLYVTDFTGIRRFGKHSVRPAYHDEEHRYIKLIISKQDSINNALQDKIYGFYNEKNRGTDMYMWKTYVTQICMTDTGGPKNKLQFIWTSQLNARLFCGDMEQKQHFSELLDIATVEADHWQDTRVYGLFQNEWGMRAVCVYTIQDIDQVFKTSPFKNSDKQPDRPRMCVADSTKLAFETLKQIEASCEMKTSIQPVKSLGPTLISFHHYTHITSDAKGGAVHKVRHEQTGSESNAFIIAEYKPFSHRAHIVSMGLNPSTKKLYVTSRTEAAQLDVANCQRYGDVCEECVLARDPYCGWSEGRCLENGPLQDTENGNIANCLNSTSNELQIKVRRLAANKKSDVADPITVPRGSPYFFECPVSSLHAQYSWYHDSRPVVCSGAQQQCLLLISSAQPEQEGTYTCASEEQGYRRVLAQYQLTVEDSAERYSPGLVLWVCLIAALLVQS